MIQGPNNSEPCEIFLHAAYEKFAKKHTHEANLQ